MKRYKTQELITYFSRYFDDRNNALCRDGFIHCLTLGFCTVSTHFPFTRLKSPKSICGSQIPFFPVYCVNNITNWPPCWQYNYNAVKVWISPIHVWIQYYKRPSMVFESLEYWHPQTSPPYKVPLTSIWWSKRQELSWRREDISHKSLSAVSPYGRSSWQSLRRLMCNLVPESEKGV